MSPVKSMAANQVNITVMAAISQQPSAANARRVGQHVQGIGDALHSPRWPHVTASNSAIRRRDNRPSGAGAGQAGQPQSPSPR